MKGKSICKSVPFTGNKTNNEVHMRSQEFAIYPLGPNTPRNQTEDLKPQIQTGTKERYYY